MLNFKQKTDCRRVFRLMRQLARPRICLAGQTRAHTAFTCSPADAACACCPFNRAKASCEAQPAHPRPFMKTITS